MHLSTGVLHRTSNNRQNSDIQFYQGFHQLTHKGSRLGFFLFLKLYISTEDLLRVRSDRGYFGCRFLYRSFKGSFTVVYFTVPPEEQHEKTLFIVLDLIA